MKQEELSDLEKQKMLAILYLNKIYAPGLDELVVRIAGSISGKKERESALLMVSPYLVRSGKLPLADAIARQELEGYKRVVTLARIGSELAESSPSQSLSYLREAEDLLTEIEDSDDQGVLRQEISGGYLRLKDWRKALELAKRILPPSEMVYTLRGIAEALWKVGETANANAALDDAHAGANETGQNERAGALDDVARVLAQMGRSSEAVAVWEEAITFAEFDPECPKLLWSICKEMVSLGYRQRAREVALLIKNDARRRDALSLVGEE